MLESVWATISWHYGLEALLFGTCLYLFFRRRNSSKPEFVLTEKQKDELIAEWEPEPLVPDTPEDHPLLNPRYVDGKVTKNVKIDGKDYLNMATTNFLSFVGDERIEDVAKKTIFKYGVGSCGPRGFYGTVDVHLDLEKDLAKFFGLEEAVLYSYGFATVASAIPAYAKKGDIIYVDKGVNFAVQKGLQASRAKVEWFEHNDVKHLEQLLAAQAEKDKKEPKKAATSRRFIVVEGLYANSADLCPLPQLIDLKWKYKVRIFIDESYSVGVIGKTGRGVTEHFGVDVIDVDMIMGSLENALASTGGFCVGRSYVVGHQRLSGLGYCFSASLPPLLATAAGQALKIIDEEPERILRVQEKSKKLQKGLREAAANTPFVIVGASEAPFVHVQYKGDDAEEKLDDLVERLFQSGVVVTRARYIDREEAFPIPPSVRILCQADLSEEEIQKTIEAFRSAVQDIH